MANNYVDVRVQIWQRFHFTDEADMKAIAKKIEEDGGVQNLADEKGFSECETLYDTETVQYPENNDDCSTIEVYQEDKTIWENGNNCRT